MKTFDDIILIARQTIRTELEEVKRLELSIGVEFAEVVELIYKSKGRLIVTGIGKSAIIANKIVATLNSTGTPSVFMHAADAIHGDLGNIQTNDVVICLSKSGNTPEIKVLIPLIRQMGNPVVALVSNKESFLATHADKILYAPIEKEACPNNLAPTSSTTSHLVMGDALAVALLDYKSFTSSDFARYHPGGALGKKLYLKVSDLYPNNQKPAVSQSEIISTVILEISSKRLGATAVLSDEGNLCGIITDGDIRRMLERNTDIYSLKAHDIMSKTPRTILPDAMAVEAFDLMKKNNITQLIVAENDQYLGFIHLHDLLREGIV